MLKLLGYTPSVTSLDLTSTKLRAAGGVAVARDYLGRHEGCSLTSLNLSRNGLLAEGCVEVVRLPAPGPDAGVGEGVSRSAEPL